MSYSLYVLTCNPCSNGSVVECTGTSLSSVQSHIDIICGIVILSVAMYLESGDTATAISPCPSLSKNVRTGILKIKTNGIYNNHM